MPLISLWVRSLHLETITILVQAALTAEVVLDPSVLVEQSPHIIWATWEILRKAQSVSRATFNVSARRKV